MTMTQMFFRTHCSRILAAGALVLSLAILPAGLAAQWLPSGATSGPIYYNGGNGGIGTSGPGTASQFLLSGGGTSGISMISYGLGNQQLTFGARYNGSNWVALDNNLITLLASPTGLTFQSVSNTTPAGPVANSSFISPLTTLYTGNVGIGTTDPQHTLHVAGTIGAEQVIVSSTGADYVFDPGYQLWPLREVASYVEENHHLPGIPSAEEMTRPGVSIGEMQTKLLAKIEELTLHIIQIKQQNDSLELQNRELERRVGQLEASQ